MLMDNNMLPEIDLIPNLQPASMMYDGQYLS